VQAETAVLFAFACQCGLVAYGYGRLVQRVEQTTKDQNGLGIKAESSRGELAFLRSDIIALRADLSALRVEVGRNREELDSWHATDSRPQKDSRG
jgi:hypothetical protein